MSAALNVADLGAHGGPGARFGPSPDPAARRHALVRLGLWMFLATVAMLFAAFSSAYLVRRGGSDWSHASLPSVLWRNTIVLALSSVALEAAWHGGRRRRTAVANAAFGTALFLGVAFVMGQWDAWQEWQRVGFFLASNPSMSFFYMMTAAHALHVVAALVVLSWGATLTWRGGPAVDLQAWSASIGHCRTFWHFLLCVWVYLFAFVSLI